MIHSDVRKELLSAEQLFWFLKECVGHPGIKDSKTVWLGNSDHVFSTGFGKVNVLCCLCVWFLVFDFDSICYDQILHL